MELSLSRAPELRHRYCPVTIIILTTGAFTVCCSVTRLTVPEVEGCYFDILTLLLPANTHPSFHSVLTPEPPAASGKDVSEEAEKRVRSIARLSIQGRGSPQGLWHSLPSRRHRMSLNWGQGEPEQKLRELTPCCVEGERAPQRAMRTEAPAQTVK